MNNIFDEFRAALFTVWHRKWLALAVAWGVCLAGWLVVGMIPNSYESKARIFVKLEDALSDVTGVKTSNKRDIDRVQQTLTSAVNLEKVIRGTPIGAEGPEATVRGRRRGRPGWRPTAAGPCVP